MMKSNFKLFVFAIVVAGNGCKKPIVEPVPVDSPPQVKKWIVTTIAGEGSPTFINGPALSATFHFPEGIVVFSDGTIFITDVVNRVVRKLSAGQVSTFAGNGDFGISDGNGAIAKFESPYSITSDANRNIYTTDEIDPRVRKILPDGEVSTYAGIETPGFADGNANASQFKPGNYLVADPMGNLYLADAGNNRIRKISTSGQVTTLAGTGIPGLNNGDAATAQFNFPGGIAIDNQGTVYVADRGNFLIRKISSTGNVTTFAGSGIAGEKDGSSNESQFSLDMRGLTIDSQGNLYLSEGDRIRKINQQGTVSTIAGSTPGYKDGEGTMAKFNYPNGLGIDGQGKIYVADLNNNRIRKISYE